MTRRAATGFARLLPVLLIAGAVIVLVGAAALAACGGSSGGSSPEPTVTDAETASGTAEPSTSSSSSTAASPSGSASAATTPIRLYFLRGKQLGVAERRVPKTKAIGGGALAALFGGPAETESAAGLSTSLATGVAVDSLSISGGLANVDVSSRFTESGEGLDKAHSLLPAAQIVYTLTQFPSVRRVAIRVDGEPFPAGGGAPRAWRRRDFVDFEPAIFVESPGVGAVLSNPFKLTGTAMVYEGTFIARLVDSSSRRVANVVMQASVGAPERGTFSKEIASSTSAKRGTLIVYQESMEDGSRLDEVRIPVTFAR